jgi:hypothetical protein
MTLACTVSHPPNGRCLARHTGSSTGRVAVAAPTWDEALTKMRDELQYRSEWRPCSGAGGDTVELQVREGGGRPGTTILSSGQAMVRRLTNDAAFT